MTLDFGVWRELNEMNPRRGGTQFIGFGNPGSGKTTLLQNFVVDAGRRGQTCIWRAEPIDTFNVFHNLGRLLVLKPWWVSYRWTRLPTGAKNLSKGEEVDPEADLGFDVAEYGTCTEALDACERGRVNVILTLLPQEVREIVWWANFARALTQRLDSRWVMVAMDEIDDLIPDAPQDLEYYAQREFKRQLRHFRKRRISLRAMVHDYQDINSRVLTKFRFRGYLRGAIRVKGKTRVFQPVIDRLRVGEGIVEASYFEHFTFPPIEDRYAADYLVGVQYAAEIRPGRAQVERETQLSQVVHAAAADRLLEEEDEEDVEVGR